MTMISTYWDTVMNPEKNPLARLPKIARFQLMTVLALMWSVIFCASAGLFMWTPQFFVGHVALLLLGIFGTGYIFRVNSEEEAAD
ncbi:MAG: hypothetical protein HC834_10250 [Rhodospirillales bacterium]|nr:hypothetical protein [Rhodospirillales bacterium]